MYKHLFPSNDGQSIERLRHELMSKLTSVNGVTFDSAIFYNVPQITTQKAYFIKDIISPNNPFEIKYSRSNSGTSGTISNDLQDILKDFGDIQLGQTNPGFNVKVELVLKSELKFIDVSSLKEQIENGKTFNLFDLLHLIKIQDYKDSEGRLCTKIPNWFLVNVLGKNYLFQVISDGNFQGWRIEKQEYPGKGTNPVCCLHIKQ